MMDKLYDLKDLLCEELEKVAPRGELSTGELETLHKLTDTIKNIDKIIMLEEDAGYSNDAGYGMGGNMGTYSRDGEWEATGTYNRGNSYRGRKRDSMGRYSRAYDDGMSMRGGRGYSRTGYSRADEMEHIETKIREMMDSGNVTTSQRDALKKAMEIIREA